MRGNTRRQHVSHADPRHNWLRRKKRVAGLAAANGMPRYRDVARCAVAVCPPVIYYAGAGLSVGGGGCAAAAASLLLLRPAPASDCGSSPWRRRRQQQPQRR